MAEATRPTRPGQLHARHKSDEHLTGSGGAPELIASALDVSMQTNGTFVPASVDGDRISRQESIGSSNKRNSFRHTAASLLWQLLYVLAMRLRLVRHE